MSEAMKALAAGVVGLFVVSVAIVVGQELYQNWRNPDEREED